MNIEDKRIYGENIITIGMFDQHTHQQEISKTDYIRIIEDTIFSFGFFGATILTEGIFGIFRHEDGTIVREPSIRVEINGSTRREVLPLIRSLREKLNQESIMYRYTEQVFEFVDIEYDKEEN